MGGPSDTYREVARHGGIPETYFWPYIGHRWGCGTGLVEDLAAETAEHPFFDDFWASKAADLSRITVPAFVVASWSDQGLHTRGTFEGFKKIGSRRKWLDAHGGKKWGYYYAPESLRRQEVRGRLAASRHLAGAAVPRRRDEQPARGRAG